MLTRESRELSGEPTCLQWLHVYGLVRSFMLEFFRVVSCIFVAPDLLAPGKMIRQANPNDGETVKAGHGRPECFFFLKTISLAIINRISWEFGDGALHGVCVTLCVRKHIVYTTDGACLIACQALICNFNDRNFGCAILPLSCSSQRQMFLSNETKSESPPGVEFSLLRLPPLEDM